MTYSLPVSLRVNYKREIKLGVKRFWGWLIEVTEEIAREKVIWLDKIANFSAFKEVCIGGEGGEDSPEGANNNWKMYSQ